MRTGSQIVVVVLLCTALTSCYQTARKYQAWVDLDGKGPPGFPGLPANSADPGGVLLYRFGQNDTLCFDSFSSKELHDRLLPKDRMAVTVEYAVSKYFGKVYGYNVRSVDGIVLAKLPGGDPGGGGGVARHGQGRASGDDCW